MALARLAEFIAGLRLESMPVAVVRKARLTTLDTIGVAIGGAASPELQMLASRLDAGGSATLLGGGRRVAPRDAALWNGTSGSVLELYEGSRFTRGPTAIQFLPAALAEAERAGTSGRDLLTALVAGYEVASRLARAGHLKDEHHPSGTWGVMGAAAAVGWLRRLPGPELRGVVDLAASLCLTTSLHTVREGATVRNAYAGISNSLGILAADLHQSGFRGLSDGAERIYGALLCDRFDPSGLDRDLGAPFEIERSYFKRHACYRHSHAALDALERILAGTDLPLADIRAIHVETYDFAARLTNPAPETTLAAQFSIPHALAARCVLGHAGPPAFLEDALGDVRIAALRRRVAVVERPDYTAMQPDRRPATVRVELEDGRVASETVELPRGEPEDPLTSAELGVKFMTLVVPRLGEKAGRELSAELSRLEEVPNVTEVTARALGA